MLKLFNTLTHSKEIFTPLQNKQVGLYTCGPTVYNFAHIGNLRTYLFEDILKRVLLFNGYNVKHVMNITDVGHLTSDADIGEDKMEKGALREGKSAWEIAKFYTERFKENLRDLNILPADILCPATEHIPEQIALVQKLIDKGLTYTTSDGIYFDTTKIDDYGKLSGLKKQKLKAGARVEMGEKKNPHDFALWKWSERSELHPERPQGAEGSMSKINRQMEWQAFGRMGFPGWHIECSAMSMKYLGEQFDIHCGGIDHISVHHTNEIAQSEAATGKKPWVKYWMYGEFLNIAAGKMAKSGENFITLDTLKEKGISPLSYRYFLLQTHYRKRIAFSWKALSAAQTGLNNFYKSALVLKNVTTTKKSDIEKVKKEFLNAVDEDLNMPKALAIARTAVQKKKIDLPTLLKFDEVLGLGFDKIKDGAVEISPEVQKLLDERQAARENKDWVKSDLLREKILKLGFGIEDKKEEQKLTKI